MKTKRGLLKNRKAMEIKILAWWLIALAILGIMFGAYLIFSEDASGALEYAKNIFRFRK